MRVGVELRGREEALASMLGLSGGKVNVALAKGLNDAAYEAKRGYLAEMESVFDRPTAYIKKSLWVRQATPESLIAWVEPSYMGGKGVDPQKILRAQAEDGRRSDKRSEAALRRIGILPNGWQTAIPSDPFPGSEDAHGNLKGSFLVQLLSYFQAFSEQGYRANMTPQRKKALQTRGGAKVKMAGPRLSRRYIVTYGKMRGGARVTARGEQDERMSNLPPGIWAVMGSGAVIKPVLMFTRSGDYKVRLSMEAVAQRSNAGEYLDKRIRYQLRKAAGV